MIEGHNLAVAECLALRVSNSMDHNFLVNTPDNPLFFKKMIFISKRRFA